MILTLSSTSRQILVSYTAPDNNPCTIEVSESASYSPVVNDVNNSLFSGSNSDNSALRSGTLGTGTTTRAVVIGTMQQPNGTVDLTSPDRIVADGVTNNTTTITSATAALTQADVNKQVILSGGSPATSLTAIIHTVTNSTTAVLTMNPDTTATGVTITIKKVIPRVLRVNTTHYVRVTCGGDTGTGSISTKNMPRGKTWPEPKPMLSAGSYAIPTLDPTSRSETLLDPQIGTLLRKISITSDDDDTLGYTVASDNGAQWPCSQTTVADSTGALGYLCMFATSQGVVRLYWARTGAIKEWRYFGLVRLGAGVVTDFTTGGYVGLQSSKFGSDPTTFFHVFADDSNNFHILRGKFPDSGDSYWDASAAAGSIANTSWLDRTPGPNHLTKLMEDFATAGGDSYDKTKFYRCFYQHVQGNYLHFTALRGQQNTYGWIGAADISVDPATVTGFTPYYLRGPSGSNNRWCGYHTTQPAIGTDLMSWESHSLSGGGGVGGGPYQTTITSDMTSGSSTITLASNTPTSPEAETTLYAIAEGDEIQLSTAGTEIMVLGSFVSGTTWNVATRAYAGTFATAHTSGATVSMQCKGGHHPGDYTSAAINWWNFVADPHGTDTTSTNLKQINDGIAGHQGWANGRNIGSGWVGGIVAAGTAASAFYVSNSPAFAGASRDGNGWMEHASPPQQSAATGDELKWGLDYKHPYGDIHITPTSVTNITGSLFRLANTNYTIDKKRLPLLVFIGRHPVLDISSATTGNVIGGTSADYYKFCMAHAVNECRTGSSVGDFYINGPGLTTGSTCPVGAVGSTDNSSVCFGSLIGAGGQGVVQIGIFEEDTTGKYLRFLSQGLVPYKRVASTASTHATTDGTQAIFMVSQNDDKANIWTVEIPPWPAYDSIDRNTFIQETVTLAGPGTATTALTEFGYDANFYCTSRNEVCVSAQSNNPYWFASESYSRISCPSGSCTNSIPVIPDHTIYYRHKFYDSGGALVETSGTFILQEGGGEAGGGEPPSGEVIVRANLGMTVI